MIAALEVCVWHTDLVAKHFSSVSIQELDWYKPIGGIGVELFFVVSGYVMCLNARRFQSGAAFMLARITRIVPLYWIFTSLVIVAYAINPNWRLGGADFSLGSLVRSYLILPQREYPILGVGWSLEHEMIFYALLALLIATAQPLVRKASVWIAVLLAAMGTFGFALGTGPVSRVWDFHVLSPYMLLFAFGWLVCSRGNDEKKGLAALLPLVGILIGVALCVALVTDPRDYMLLFRMVLTASFFLAVHAARAVLEIDTVINRMASAIADASYSLYLSHWFVLSAFGKLLGVLHFPASASYAVRAAGVAACVAVSLLVYRGLEHPIDRFLRGRKPASQRSAPDVAPVVQTPVPAVAIQSVPRAKTRIVQ